MGNVFTLSDYLRLELINDKGDGFQMCGLAKERQPKVSATRANQPNTYGMSASDTVLMPVVSIATCIFIGRIVKPKTVIDEVTLGGRKFGRQLLYVVMVKYVTPVLLLLLLLQALGVVKL